MSDDDAPLRLSQAERDRILLDLDRAVFGFRGRGGLLEAVARLGKRTDRHALLWAAFPLSAVAVILWAGRLFRGGGEPQALPTPVVKVAVAPVGVPFTRTEPIEVRLVDEGGSGNRSGSSPRPSTPEPSSSPSSSPSPSESPVARACALGTCVQAASDLVEPRAPWVLVLLAAVLARALGRV